MNLTTYSINPANRRWDNWLEIEINKNIEIDQYNFHQSRWYQTAGRFLCLIHFGGELKDGNADHAALVDAKWASLESSIRENVFWLVYSGGGYRSMTTRHPRNIHYLKYEVNRLSLTASDCSRFQTFFNEMTASDDIGVSIWEFLYPTENVHLATLLAILSAEEVVDIARAVDSFIADESAITSAHREFISQMMPGNAASSCSTWISQLRDHNYCAVRDQISSVLGCVPD